MYKIVLIRHGESQWNLENRFTGWVDVDLSEKGREEAKKGGQALKKEAVSYTHLDVYKRQVRSVSCARPARGAVRRIRRSAA